MGLFNAYAMPDTAADFTMTLGNMIYLGYDTPEKLHLSKEYYDIFDESYRDVLNLKIVRRFALREIGQETPQQFVFYLGRTMNEQMPYYNQLYLSTRMKFDPLSNMAITTLSDTDNESQSSGKSSAEQHSETSSTSKGSSDNRTKATSADSQTPQTSVDDFNKFVTSANQTESDAHGTSQNEQNAVTDSNSHSTTDFSHSSDKGKAKSETKGYNGLSGSQLLQQYRDAMLNVDTMVLNTLDTCFLGVWGSADDMNKHQRGQFWPGWE